MPRNIKITKVGKSTIVEVTENTLSGTEVFVFNKATDLRLRNNIIHVCQEGANLNFTLAELENKLSAGTEAAWLVAAATALLFTNN